ncbi:hypothetical protein G6F63_016120 [Rhizopus arrhizus]|nr:hypothetical protein G6F63_016120 [Rhizopus arrhizus]
MSPGRGVHTQWGTGQGTGLYRSRMGGHQGGNLPSAVHPSASASSAIRATASSTSAGSPSSRNHTADSPMLAAIQRSRRARSRPASVLTCSSRAANRSGRVATWIPGPHRSGLLNSVV